MILDTAQELIDASKSSTELISVEDLLLTYVFNMFTLIYKCL
jgi:hypothetical protein